MLITPWRKHLAFACGSILSSGYLHDIRHAKRLQLANLPCARVVVREPPADKLVVFPTRRVGKTATRVAMPLCTRSAASSAPAPPESSDKTMTSEGAIGSLTTSAHPAARKTISRTDGTATMAAAANATSTRIGAHLRRRGSFMMRPSLARSRPSSDKLELLFNATISHLSHLPRQS
jgi:hypothetical protein